jgi:hypothetical protein
VVPWIGLKKDIIRIVNSGKELKILSHLKNLYSYFFSRRVKWAQTAIFAARPPKMRESQQLFFGGRLLIIIFEELQHPAI